jgi:hypothetical protein
MVRSKMRTGARVATPSNFRLDPLLHRLVSEGIQKHALDNIRYSVGALGVRNGHCVHHGRPHSPFALGSSSGFGDSPVSRAQDSVEKEFRIQEPEARMLADASVHILNSDSTF